MRLTAYKRLSAVGDAEGARQSVVRSSIRADLLYCARDGEEGAGGVDRRPADACSTQTER